MSVQGYLVYVGKTPQVVMPATSIVNKQGNKQFYFWSNGKSLLAVKRPHDFYFKVN